MADLYLGAFADAPATAERLAAVHSTLTLSDAGPVARALARGRQAAGLSGELASGIEELCCALDLLGCLNDDALGRLADALAAAPRSGRLYRALVRAATLDGYLCPFEGERDPNLAVPDESEPLLFWQAWGRGLRRQADLLRVNSRWTPFGTHTDDTQFLVTGVRAGLAGPEEALTDALLGEWRTLGRYGGWRNIGKRTRGFLETGDPSVFAGPPTLGDVLRGLAVFLACEVRGVDHLEGWREYARAVGLTPEQREAVAAFLLALSASLDGERAALLRAARLLPGHFPDKGGANLFDHVRETLVERADPRAYAADLTAVGKDHDTYGFIAGLLACDEAMPVEGLARPALPEGEQSPAPAELARATADCAARVVGYCLAAAVARAGAVIEPPGGFADDALVAEQQVNWALNRLREGRG